MNESVIESAFFFHTFLSNKEMQHVFSKRNTQNKKPKNPEKHQHFSNLEQQHLGARQVFHWKLTFSCKTWAGINVPFVFTFRSQNTNDAFCRPAVGQTQVSVSAGCCMRWPGNGGSSVVLTGWIRTPRRQPCHSANLSICLETQYGRLACVLEKRWWGSRHLPANFLSSLLLCYFS